MLLLIIFAINLSLLLVHEMDAVRHKEWKMFIILKDMKDNNAYRLFTLLHIPLYTVLLLILLSPYRNIGYYIVDIFLIIHLLVHIRFRNHKNNCLNGLMSKCIVLYMGILSTIHLIILTFL